MLWLSSSIPSPLTPKSFLPTSWGFRRLKHFRMRLSKCWGKVPWSWLGILQQDFTAGFSPSGVMKVEASDWPVEPRQLCHPYQLQGGDSSLSLGSDKEGHHVLYWLEGHLLPDSCPSGFWSIPLHSLEWESFPVQSSVFLPFHSSPDLHRGVLSGVSMGSQEGNLTPSLSGSLACRSRVSSLRAGTSGTPFPLLQVPGDCHHLGESRPQASWQGSASQTPSKRGSIWQTLGLPNSWMCWTSSFSSHLCQQRCGSRF